MAVARRSKHEGGRRRLLWVVAGLAVLLTLAGVLVLTSPPDEPERRSDERAPRATEPDPSTVEPSAAPPPVEPPTWSSVLPYSEDSPWNTPLAADVAVHERSEELVTRIGDRLTSDTSQYTLPVYEVDGDTPTAEVRIVHLFSDVGDDGTSIDRRQEVTLDVPVPRDAVAAEGSDAQIVIVNTDTGEEWGFWQFEPEGDGYLATNGYRYHVGWNAVPPDGFGSRGAGVPYLTGLVRPAEMERGRIDHAIAFAYPTPSPEHVFPATKSDGQGDPELDLPEGARLRLDPSLDDDDFERMGLSVEGVIIARALQEYGMILIDVAGRPKIYAEYDGTAAWDGAITEDTVSGLPLDRFEVIDWTRTDVAPIAQPTAPEVAPIGSEFVLDGSASYDPGPGAEDAVIEYEWTDAVGREIGDDAMVRYPSGGLEPGTHRFTLRVAGDGGRWSEPRHVYVTMEDATRPYIAATYDGTGTDVDEVELPATGPMADETVVIAVVLRRLNADDGVAVDEVVGQGRSWRRILREVDEKGALVLEVWGSEEVDPGTQDQPLRVDVSARTNVAVQAVALSNVGRLATHQSTNGRTDDAKIAVEGAAGGLVLSFHAGRTEDFVAENGDQANVVNTSVDDAGGSLRLSSLTASPERSGPVEIRGNTRSPMDWAMAALAFDDVTDE